MVVSYPFEAAGPGELSLIKGSSVVILSRPAPEGWWEGQQGQVTGWFPSYCVQSSQPDEDDLDLRADAVSGADETLDGSEFTDATSDNSTTEAVPGDSSQKHFVRSKPYCTVVGMVIQFIMCMLVISRHGFTSPSLNPMIGGSQEALQFYGAANNIALQKDSQVYRLFTAIFVPVGLVRLVVDLSFQWYVCMPFEHLYGSVKYASLFLTGGIFGNLISCLIIPPWQCTGATGGMFAVAGGLYCTMYLTRKYQKLNLVKDFWFLTGLLGIYLILGCMPGGTNYMSFGGLVAGLVLGAAVLSSFYVKYSTYTRLAFYVVGVGSIWAAMAVMLAFILNSQSRICPGCMVSTCFPVYDWCAGERSV